MNTGGRAVTIGKDTTVKHRSGRCCEHTSSPRLLRDFLFLLLFFILFEEAPGGSVQQASLVWWFQKWVSRCLGPRGPPLTNRDLLQYSAQGLLPVRRFQLLLLASSAGAVRKESSRRPSQHGQVEVRDAIPCGAPCVRSPAAQQPQREVPAASPEEVFSVPVARRPLLCPPQGGVLLQLHLLPPRASAVVEWCQSRARSRRPQRRRAAPVTGCPLPIIAQKKGNTRSQMAVVVLVVVVLTRA